MGTHSVDPPVLSGRPGGMLLPDKRFGLNGLPIRQVSRQVPDLTELSSEALAALSRFCGIADGVLRSTLR